MGISTPLSTLTSLIDAMDPCCSGAANPSPGVILESISFDASGSLHSSPLRTITSYVWDFGDGFFSSGQQVSHTYVSESAYLVTLTVTDDQGGQSVCQMPVTIVGPTAVNPTSWSTLKTRY